MLLKIEVKVDFCPQNEQVEEHKSEHLLFGLISNAEVQVGVEEAVFLIKHFDYGVEIILPGLFAGSLKFSVPDGLIGPLDD